MLVAVPSTFDDRRAVAFANDLPGFEAEPELVIDFSPLNWVYPFGTLVIAHAIRQVIIRRRSRGLQTHVQGHQAVAGAVSYLKYFGFFRYIGVNAGLDVNAAPGGSRYLPVTLFNKAGLAQRQGTRLLQDTLDEDCRRLAQVIFSKPEECSAADMLGYCFRELLRNSFEHANVSSCAAMAQRWDNGLAEVVIADHGIGIYRSLSQVHEVQSEEEALRLALKPGISSGASRATGGVWDNTGFGLYVVSQLGVRYGAFSMISSERVLANPTSLVPLPSIALSGTIVKLRVSTNDAEYWPNILANIVKDGEAEAALIPGAIRSASGGSKKSNTWGG